MENLRGILLMTAAMATFALTDMFIKLSSVSLPTGQITIILGLGGLIIFSTICRRKKIAIVSKNFMNPSILFRNFCEALGTVGMLTALALAPISIVSAVFQALPLLVTLGAALFLGETVGWRRWSAICIGLVGVLIIIRPGFDAFEVSSLWVVLAAVGLAGRDVVTRTIPHHIPTPLIATYAFVILVPTGIAMLLVSGDQVAVPDLKVTAFLALMIVTSFFGYYCLTAATRLGDLSAQTPFRYSRILFALLIGFFIFDEIPDVWTYVGITLVIASGLYALGREKTLSDTQPS